MGQGHSRRIREDGRTGSGTACPKAAKQWHILLTSECQAMPKQPSPLVSALGTTLDSKRILNRDVRATQSRKINRLTTNPFSTRI